MARKQLDSSEYSRENVGRYHRKVASKGIKKGIILGIVALIVAGLAIGAIAAIRWYHSLNERLQDQTIITEDLRAVLSEPPAPSDPYYVLLLGTDGRDGEEDYRADTIILVRVDPPNKRLTLLSIPRDTYVIYKGSEMKINAAHFYDGPAGMITAVQDLTGVKISHYAEVNFDGLADITDSLGGVWVDVDMYMYDDENFNHIVSLEPGYQELNGEAALFYTRCRHFFDGDYTRMRHQREFVKAIIRQVLDDPDPMKLVNVVDTCANYVITDLSVSEIISLAGEFRGIDVDNDIYTAYAPSFGAYLGEVAYVFVSQYQLDELMEIIDRGDNPAEYMENLEVDYGAATSLPISFEPPSEPDYSYAVDTTDTTETTETTDTTDDTGEYAGDTGYDDGGYEGGGETATDEEGGGDYGE